MNFELSGTVHSIGTQKRVTEKLRKLSFAITFTDSGNYPQFVEFELKNERIDQMIYSVGDEVTVKFDVTGRVWQKDGEEKVFTTLTAWDVKGKASGHSAAAPQPPKPAAPTTPPAPAKDDSDDLPF